MIPLTQYETTFQDLLNRLRARDKPIDLAPSMLEQCLRCLHQIAEQYPFMGALPHALLYSISPVHLTFTTLSKCCNWHPTENTIHKYVEWLHPILQQHYPALFTAIRTRPRSGFRASPQVWKTMQNYLHMLHAEEEDIVQCKRVCDELIRREVHFPTGSLLHVGIIAWACPHLLDDILTHSYCLHHTNPALARTRIMTLIEFITALDTHPPDNLLAKIVNDVPLTETDRRDPALARYTEFLERFCARSPTITAREVEALLARLRADQLAQLTILL